MLFNSLDFAIFLPLFFILYWFVTNQKLKYQNLLIVIASYIFYGWWDWRFLSLIFFSSIVDYAIGCGFLITTDSKKRKLLLLASLLINFSLLFFFKYYNFFLDSFVQAFSFFNSPIQAKTIELILPVGISFYTFQTVSYSIDVYYKKITPTKDLISFLAFVSFFPQLVAGPIERATNLLPQFYKKRVFNTSQAINGLKQVLWGLFKKIVIADNCAVFVDDIFTNYTDYSGGTLIVGAVLFSFQIYCDFSGYSDIAIGISKLFGFELMTNFRTPYFSRNIAEFWRRWHISLSTWFRDYVYIPLGGSKTNTSKAIRNIFIVFIVSGFWHGANWTFIVWGGLNAIYFMPSFILKTNQKYTTTTSKLTWFPNLYDLFHITTTFGLTVIAWIFFRANNITHALSYLKGILNPENFFSIKSAETYVTDIKPLLIYLFILFFVDWIYREDDVIFNSSNKLLPSTFARYTLYTLTSLCILLSIKNQAASFIYFQF